MAFRSLLGALLLLAGCSADGGPAPAGMLFVPGGEFEMGGVGPEARADELPRHRAHVEAFWMDATEVTNAQFRAFVEATGYLTTAERKPDWQALARELPPGTPRPDDALLVPGALVFTPTDAPVPLDDVSRWWKWTPGACWRHPLGPQSALGPANDREPVVQVSWDDALAYARWCDKRLPSETEWEFAARGGLEDGRYAWKGDKLVPGGVHAANLYQGQFPSHDTLDDGFERVAPVGSFPPNGYGLSDMIGNVWEWCADTYSPGSIERVQRGGSFLCNACYCASYRPSARMACTPDSAANHVGFRCVRDARP
ncbi:MAG: formylglycine-generating enzyme family protein [Planctomycetes bacterium]|nr:formylglycine-generating enzyme family protein [Planctomycetota bacterium]